MNASLRDSSASTSRRSSGSSISSHLLSSDQDRAAGGVDALGQALVLAGDALGGVDHEQGDVGVVDRPQGPHERVVLGRVVDPRAPAHAGGVDEHDRSVLGLDERVDGVAGRAGEVVDDGAVLADEAVEQRRLADVGPPDDGDARRPRLVRRPRLLELDVGVDRRRRGSPVGAGACGREAVDDDVEQVAGAPAVQGADRVRLAETEGQELPALVLAAVVVGLVGDDDDVVAAAAQPVGDGLVVVGHPDGRVDDEQHDVGVLRRPPRPGG